MDSIARWTGAGGEPSARDELQHLAVETFNGDLIVGGEFDSAGGIAASRIARWDGAAWHPVGSGIDPSPAKSVKCLARHGGDLIAGGRFGSAGEIAASNIARWTGAAWQPLGGGVDGEVRAVASYGGEVIAGGNFLRADGVLRRGIARWDGTSWHEMGDGIAQPASRPGRECGDGF